MKAITRDSIIDVEAVESFIKSDDCCGENATQREVAIGKILIFACFIGEDPEALSIASRVSILECLDICTILKVNGVFGGGVDHFSVYFGEKQESSVIALIMDIGCAEGKFRRTKNKSGETSWCLTVAGICYVEQELLSKAALSPDGSFISLSTQEIMDKLDEANGGALGTWREKLGKKAKP